MNVLIRGMKMPTVCDRCFALDEHGDYPRCLITDEQRGYNFRTREKRMDKCPLVPVPPHGDLIDINTLKLAIVNVDYVNKHDYLKGVLNAINNAPTVIPAEEGET